MNGFLIDTHVWYWLLGAMEANLLTSDRDLLEAAAERGELHLSAMSIWETAQKQASGRLLVSVESLMEQSFANRGIHLIDLSTSVLISANRLPGVVHGDPVDRILAATAREHGLTLVTHDIELRRYAKQGHLRVHKV